LANVIVIFVGQAEDLGERGWRRGVVQGQRGPERGQAGTALI
jgi:hypothetical protein